MTKRSCKAKTDEIKFSTSLLGQEGTQPNLFEHEEIQYFLLPELRSQFILILYVWPKFRNKINLLKNKTKLLDLCKWVAGLHILQSTHIYLRHSQSTGKPAKLEGLQAGARSPFCSLVDRIHLGQIDTVKGSLDWIFFQMLPKRAGRPLSEEMAGTRGGGIDAESPPVALWGGWGDPEGVLGRSQEHLAVLCLSGE